MTGLLFMIVVGIYYGGQGTVVGTSGILKLPVIVPKSGCTQILLFKRKVSHFDGGLKVSIQYQKSFKTQK